MKSLCVMLFFALSLSYVRAQEVSATEKGPAITFEQSTYGFGKITEGDTVSYVFSFTNTGGKELLLFNVQTTCGCTAPTWPRTPIQPGAQGKVEVVFNSTGKKGVQNKTITVSSNAENSSSYLLTLQGEVSPKS